MCEKQHGDLLREILAIQSRKGGLNGQEVCVCVCVFWHMFECVYSAECLEDLMV